MKRVRYTQEQREWAITQMMPPLNRRVTELARVTGITTVTLRTWQNTARAEGKIVPGDGKQANRWSSTDKFLMVLEAAPLSAVELSAYCRSKGLYPEQIAEWRLACEQSNLTVRPTVKSSVAGAPMPLAADQLAQAKRISQLERSMKKKDRALAEAEALLVLQKKSTGDLGEGQGRMISAPDRRNALALIDEAIHAGARQQRACAVVGLSTRTVQRWRDKPVDGRPQAFRAQPANRLSDMERQAVLETANRPDGVVQNRVTLS